MLKTEQETGVTLHTKLKFYLCKRDDNFQFVELHRKCRVVTIRKKLIKLHIKLTKD